MNELQSILMWFGLLSVALGWLLWHNWSEQGLRERTINLIVAVACIGFVSVILADFLGEQQILRAFSR